ncbi:Uncharacterized protein dnm_037520 [Desulfonema magnum]|uniref:Uncharacterized protein n=1 Tax=Desulfonema magnum TaxID=45655 RepID=A0A975GNF7_9BACT|nr:Uncharacterized protein dnm_037520 [Desulfonema magnum]
MEESICFTIARISEFNRLKFLGVQWLGQLFKSCPNYHLYLKKI